MKFLLDVGISPRLGDLLETLGHSYRYMPNYYSNKTDDIDILKIARENQEIVITHDLDFGSLLAFSKQNTPSVILFRIHHINPQLFFNLISENWKTINKPIEEGAFIVFEINSLRIRPLPILK